MFYIKVEVTDEMLDRIMSTPPRFGGDVIFADGGEISDAYPPYHRVIEWHPEGGWGGYAMDAIGALDEMCRLVNAIGRNADMPAAA